MLIKKEQAREKQNSKDCTVWEYEYPSENFSLASALINGRYPEENKVANTECEEIYYVISGSGTIHSDKGDFVINQGDLYHFEKNEVYWIEGNDLFIVLVNAPKWTVEQYREVI